MSKTISINNQKGGVGKTTTALAMGSILTEQGSKVLLVDCDGSSCSLTKNILKQLGSKEPPRTTLTDLIISSTMGRDFRDIIPNAILHSPRGYDIIPADDKLTAVTMSLSMQNNLETRFHTVENILSAIKDEYDYIILDSAPVLDIFSINQLISADELIIVTQCQKASVDAVYELLRSVEQYIRPQKPNFSISGILPTMFDRREKYSQKTLENFKKDLVGVTVFETIIPYTVHAKRCVDSGSAITEFDKNSQVAKAYQDFVEEWKGATK